MEIKLQNLPEILTLTEVSELLKCHPNTLRNWEKAGLLKSLRVGARGDRRYKREDVLEFIEKAAAEEPVAAEPDLKVAAIIEPTYESEVEIPLFLEGVPAGFPSVAGDYVDSRLDLNQFLIRHPSSTFFIRVYGNSMINAGIHSGDILIVDRAEEPKHNQIVVAAVDGELTIKRIRKDREGISLVPDNPEYPIIKVSPESEFRVWGIVTNVIHPLK